MAMKKVEMERHKKRYHTLMAKARSSQKKGLYRDAVEAAIRAWEFIDGMMQYERRYEEKEFDGIKAIDMVLRYAPMLLDFEALNNLERLLREKKRIDKNTNESLAKQLVDGRSLLWDMHRLWDHLEHHPDVQQSNLRQHLGGNQERWRAAVVDWEEMGLLRRTVVGTSYRLALATRLGEVVLAKCPSCGTVAMAPKAMLLEHTTCLKCKTKVLFVFIAGEGMQMEKAHS